MKIAIQLYSLRDEMVKDFEGTLKKVSEMGYEGVEFAGTLGQPPSEIKKLCDDLNLVPISAHIPFVDMMNNEGVLEYYKEIGCEYVVIPYLTEEYRPDGEKFGELIEGAKKLSKKAEELGLTLCYHNHDFEFVKIGQEYALDYIYRQVPQLSTQIDTCWSTVAGVDTCKYLEKYTGRVKIVHLKDFTGTKSENMYKLIGIDDDKKQETDGNFEFRPLGMGTQNFPAIIEASEKAGASWVVYEMDDPSMGKTPLECAKISIDYLKTIM